jgi:hypothetical protein
MVVHAQRPGKPLKLVIVNKFTSAIKIRGGGFYSQDEVRWKRTLGPENLHYRRLNGGEDKELPPCDSAGSQPSKARGDHVVGAGLYTLS